MSSDVVRLWYSTGSRCWLVDYGPGTVQRYTDRVEFHMFGLTFLNTEQQWPDGPYAWIEFRNADIYYTREQTVIYKLL